MMDQTAMTAVGAPTDAASEERPDHRRRSLRLAAITVAFGASALAFGPAAVATPSAPQTVAAPPAGQLVAADDQGPPDASTAQRAAAELAVSSALANNPLAPAQSSTYAKAGGMGELAVTTGQATTAATTAPNEPLGVTLAPVFETTAASELVNYDGHNFSYASIQNGRAEIVGSTSIGQDQQIIIIRNSAAPTSYAFRLSQNQIDIGASVRLSTSVPGGAEVVAPGGNVIATVSKPWARTATGAPVPTSFSISGGQLVQKVTTAGLPASAYPVTADPSTTQNCGYITCTWYFSVARSKKLADDTLTTTGAFVAGLNATMICGLVTLAAAGAPGVNLLLGVVCYGLSFAVMESWRNNLGDARKKKRCFTISSPPRGPFGNVPLSNKYCHRK
jgi:hypothetical protein